MSSALIKNSSQWLPSRRSGISLAIGRSKFIWALAIVIKPTKLQSLHVFCVRQVSEGSCVNRSSKSGFVHGVHSFVRCVSTRLSSRTRRCVLIGWCHGRCPTSHCCRRRQARRRRLSGASELPTRLRYDTIRYIYARSKADERASLIYRPAQKQK